MDGYWEITTTMQPAVGEPVDKIGRSTGLTSGVVQYQCVDVTQYVVDGAGVLRDTGVDMLCQDQASYSTLVGDSGGPVFTRPWFGTRVAAVGLHWGAEAAGNYGSPDGVLVSTYSPIGFVLNGLGREFGEESLALWCYAPLWPAAPGCT